MANQTSDPVWTEKHVQGLAPDAASIPAARQVLKKGGFGTVEPTADGRGWWVVCRGLTDTYQVSARRDGSAFDCDCTCPSPKNPCKHALALLFHLVAHPELRTEAEASKAAATDFEALIRAVFANPDDDTPRLVFADYLDENSDADRAALIRFQCERARLKPQSKRHRELAAQLGPVLARVRKRIEPLPEGVNYRLERGFLRLEGDLGHLSDVGALPDRIAVLFRDGWVEALRLNVYAFMFSASGLGALAGQVGELDVSTFPLPDDPLTRFAAEAAAARANGRLVRVKVHKRDRKAFDHLTRAQAGDEKALAALAADLDAERYYGNLTPQTFELFRRAKRFDGARRLRLAGPVGDAELAALASCDVGGLQELMLIDWRPTAAGWAALAGSRAFAALTVLELADCGLTDAGAAALAARGFPNLASLDLGGNQRLTAAGVAALLATPHFPRLTDVNLGGTAVGAADLLPLALDAADRASVRVRFDDVAAVRTIESGAVGVQVTGARHFDLGALFDRFADCPGAKRLTLFSATRARITAADLPRLAAGLDPKTLRRLHLIDNPLRNEGAAALATAFAGFALDELALRGCRIQSAGVAALIVSPLFAKLKSLDLSNNAIGKAGAAALLKADAPPGLKGLVLTDCRLGLDDKKRLAAKFGAKVKL